MREFKPQLHEDILAMIQHTHLALRERVLTLQFHITPAQLWARLADALHNDFGLYSSEDARIQPWCVKLLNMHGWYCAGNNKDSPDAEWRPGLEWHGLRVVKALRDSLELANIAREERAKLRAARCGEGES